MKHIVLNLKVKEYFAIIILRILRAQLSNTLKARFSGKRAVAKFPPKTVGVDSKSKGLVEIHFL